MSKNSEARQLDPQNVPNELHPLIPLAELWGETDDYIRGNLLGQASRETLRNLVQMVHLYAEPLRRWLFAEYEKVRLGGAETSEQAAFLGLETVAIESQVILKVKYGEEHEL